VKGLIQEDEKGKVTPLQARRGSEVSRRLRFRDLKTIDK